MLKNYIKIALKVLLRRKFFTFISLFGISFTLSVLMIITSILDNIFGEIPPEINQYRSLGIYSIQTTREVTTIIDGDQTPDGKPREITKIESKSTGPPGYMLLNKYIRNVPFAETVTIFSIPLSVSTYIVENKLDLFLKRTDGEFWKVFKFNFIEGMPYSQQDEENSNLVCVINRATKEKIFEKKSALGKFININDQNFRIMGVVENIPALRLNTFSDVWVPISTSPSKDYLKNIRGNYLATILAKDRSDFKKIKAEVESRIRNADISLNRDFNTIKGFSESIFENFSRIMFSSDFEDNNPNLLLGIIIALMLLFMILPTLNLVNINISRIMERSSEIGIRKAFGASSRTLVFQFITENIILTICGGLIGLLLTKIGLTFIESTGVIKYAQFNFNARIFMYGFMITLFFGIFSGILPAWKMSKLHPVDALKGDGK